MKEDTLTLEQGAYTKGQETRLLLSRTAASETSFSFRSISRPKPVWDRETLSIQYVVLFRSFSGCEMDDSLQLRSSMKSIRDCCLCCLELIPKANGTDYLILIHFKNSTYSLLQTRTPTSWDPFLQLLCRSKDSQKSWPQWQVVLEEMQYL